MKNIILTGMPASGKSTIGVLLAKAVGYDFVDTDLIIQRQEGRQLQQIIAEDGLEAFLMAENRALVAASSATSTVIATGGSAVFSDDGMTALCQNGICVYLKAPLDIIKTRLVNIKTRGIAAPKGQSIEDIFAERTPLYQRYADISIDTTALDTEQTVSAIIKALKF